MIFTAVFMLVFAGVAAAQAPLAPTAAPEAPDAPSAPLAQEHHKALTEEITRGIAEGLKAMDAALRSEEIALRVQQELMRSDQFKRAMQMAELAKQLPVPPVAPIPPRDPRERMREAQRAKQPRRRFPEGWVESTEPFSRSFKVGRNAALMLANIAGNIQVSPGGNDQIDVQALKHAWGPNAEQAKQRLGDVTIEAYATGNRVELRVQQGGGRDGRGLDVEFDVKVPPDTSVELRSVSGDLRVTNIRGEIRVQGVSGNLALEGTPRLAMVKTVSGDITLTNAGADVQLSVSTVNGDLIAQTLSARSLDLNTINGDVRIGGWSGERANIRTLDGDMDLQTSLTKGARYEIESHSGDIQLSLPEQPGFELETHTFSGRIRIDFPIRSEGPVRDNDRGPRSIRGTYGDGSSSLRVQTFSGDLTVTKR
jgi:hypothetical protein